MSGIGAAGMTAGSIEGAGDYLLGAKALTVGGNNLSTEVTGVISGNGGALTKVGAGTLTLSGANTYGGGTTISSGTLVAISANGGAIDSLGTGDVCTMAARWVSTRAARSTTPYVQRDKTSTIAAGSQTLSLDIGFLGANANAQFGKAADTGTIIVIPRRPRTRPTRPSWRGANR